MERIAHDGLTVEVFEQRAQAEGALAEELAALIAERNARAATTVFGLASGGSPVGVYRRLVAAHRAGSLDFSRVVTFNLDEYEGLAAEDPNSFHAFMREHLFDHVDLARGNTHLLSGDIAPGTVESHCAAYEAKILAAGGLDLQLLGIGSNGHIAFNEPGSTQDSRTRRVELDPATRSDAQRDFSDGEPPTHALTVGVATILAARRIRLVAFGEHKAQVLRDMLEGPVGPELPASFLRGHGDTKLFVDGAAARLLRG
jgi:glucosamine-6-phosphate deaminase